MGKLIVVVGGQYGSEAKGSVVAHLTRTERREEPMVVRVGGPNAGHTVYDDDGRRWPMRQIPVGFVRSDASLVIGAGSVVDDVVLHEEFHTLEEAGHRIAFRLYIDQAATMLTEQHHRHEETSGITDRIGSTSKGIGIARADRIMRTVATVGDVPHVYELSRTGRDTSGELLIRDRLESGGTVIIEATQGYALGLHRGWYPFATSQDCTAVDACAQAQISPWDRSVSELEIWIVFRTFPIRVAGNSGPLSFETTWEALAEQTGGYIKPEQTTVTKKVRRVGLWDGYLARQALAANGGAANPRVHIALMMTDYLEPGLAGDTDPSVLLDNVIWPMAKDMGKLPELIGTGPQSIVDRRS